MTLGVLAAVSAAVFFGAAVYVLFVEHAARGELDDQTALAEWKPAYKRGAIMQGGIALLTAGLGIAAWLQFDHPAFLIGAILAALPWPWTLFVIRPTNDQLLALPMEQAGMSSRHLLQKWGRLHSVRTLLGGLATISFVIALMSGPSIKPSADFKKFLGERGSFYPQQAK
ncbi:MAG: DUF1772 domain-containing protein [Rhodospirillaceae bacterium]|nr:DUF1772 domain-containing protein [Rhodospirillaceae bacterium]